MCQQTMDPRARCWREQPSICLTTDGSDKGLSKQIIKARAKQLSQLASDGNPVAQVSRLGAESSRVESSP